MYIYIYIYLYIGSGLGSSIGFRFRLCTSVCYLSLCLSSVMSTANRLHWLALQILCGHSACVTYLVCRAIALVALLTVLVSWQLFRQSSLRWLPALCPTRATSRRRLIKALWSLGFVSLPYQSRSLTWMSSQQFVHGKPVSPPDFYKNGT